VPDLADQTFMTNQELAQRLRRPLATVRYWRATGTGPRGARIGGRVLYRSGDVNAWIEEQYAQEERVAPTRPEPHVHPRPRVSSAGSAEERCSPAHTDQSISGTSEVATQAGPDEVAP